MGPIRGYTSFVVLLCGFCGCATDDPPEISDPDFEVLFAPQAYDQEWNRRNADIYRHLLSELEPADPERICFLTITPQSLWNEQGDWRSFPSGELKRFPNTTGYLPAEKAHLSDHKVLRNESNSEAWMHWISVRRWLSETEVEVEEGTWCCPLGGGGGIYVYEKTPLGWELKSIGFSWVS